MSVLIYEELSAFVTDNGITTREIISRLQKNESGIIEIVGESGSGKIYLFKNLHKELLSLNSNVDMFIPNFFKYNQLFNVLKLVSSITENQFDNILLEAKELKISSKYDLFYYITESLTEKDLLKPTSILVYEGYLLENYTIDFIQYLVEFSKDICINFIIFNHKETFIFSEKYYISKPDTKVIRKIIQKIKSNNKEPFIKESELINEIAEGNLFIVEYLLEQFTEKNEELDFSSYLSKGINVSTIHNESLERLTPAHLETLIIIFLINENTTIDIISSISNQKNCVKLISDLAKEGFIFNMQGNYYVKNIPAVQSTLFNLSEKKKEQLFKQISEKLDKSKTTDFRIKINNYDKETLLVAIKNLSLLNDYESLKLIRNRFKHELKNPQEIANNLVKIGDANNHLSKPNEAIENYREALKILVDNKIPAERVLYKFAQSLYNINSSAFALELIKKYSPEYIDVIAQCNILLLKSEILTEMEEFDESLQIASTVYNTSNTIFNNEERINILAKYRKLLGKIFYYVNEWSKSENEYKLAYNHYEKVSNYEGMAAISNNLGSLAMAKGEWKNAELQFRKSLEFENRNYNLDGLSVTYSNLGSLFDDKSNYKKSLEYLLRALKIQKLLNNKYKITNIYNNIGVTYMDNGKYKKAEKAFLSSLEISFDVKQYKNLIATLNNLGALYFKWGNFKSAIDYYERAVKHSKADNFPEGLCQSYNNIGELYENRREYELALDFYKKGEDLLQNISDEFIQAELFGNIGSVLTNLHRFKEAYKYLIESFDYFKSLEAIDKITEGSHKLAYYFIKTRNYESSNYHLDKAMKFAEDIESEKLIGKTFLLKSMLEKNEPKIRQKYLENSLEYFVKSNDDFELAIANLEYAELLFEIEEWEQALQILEDNRKIIITFDAINILEKNDILIKSIKKKYEKEVIENRSQEALLGKFYELTNDLNQISDFELLLDSAIKKLVSFAHADGGIFCMYPNTNIKDSWKYITTEKINVEDHDFKMILDLAGKAFENGVSYNEKQPHFAPEYNNIIAFPLSVRNEKKGIIALFTKYGSNYFTENMYNLLSALCNQIVVIVENISYSNLQKKHEIIREELAASSSFSNIIGKSKKLQDLFRMIEKIKNTDTTVLLEGASGTGKELIARAIHYNSNKKNKAFIAQYCGALPETLLESELFGHVKGSFTGASYDKKGLFEIADGGTFFLDEIADISLSTQAKLLRFLQEGEIKRVGAVTTQTVDVRVICATNVSLKEKVDRGEFRLDLYYRLNVIKMDIPSLEERKSDIPLLAIHFLDKFCKKIHKKINGITDEAMNLMKEYNWPGNIRQLENEIERAVTLSDEDAFISSSDLSDEIIKYVDNTETISLLEKESLKSAVEKLEITMIKRVLIQVDWNQTKTAKELGLSRQGLIKKIHRYGISKGN